MTDEKLIELTVEFRKGIMGRRRNPSRMCFMVASPLQGYLAFLGFETTLIESQLDHINHFWLELPDGRALDPTADQFDEYKNTPVYLGKPHPVIHAKENR